MPDTEVGPPFEAYKGLEPYVFISYAHGDAPVVFPDLWYLANQGHRIWYDEGIDPGNEWPEEIAGALNGCSLFIVFISERAVRSVNVRNEINFALNRNKPFLAIHIDDTNLPPGLELRMGGRQAIIRFQTSRESYFRKIERRITAVLSRAPADDLSDSASAETSTPDKPASPIPDHTTHTDDPAVVAAPGSRQDKAAKAIGKAIAPDLAEGETASVLGRARSSQVPVVPPSGSAKTFLDRRDFRIAAFTVVAIIALLLLGVAICSSPNGSGCGIGGPGNDSGALPTATSAPIALAPPTLTDIPARPTASAVPPITTATLPPTPSPVSPTAVPAASRSIVVSPTHTRTATLTSTLTSTATATTTASPTRLTTSSPTLAATRIVPTAVPPTKTTAPVVTHDAPVASAPAFGAEFSAGVTLEWNWTRALGNGETFQVLAWKDGETEHRALGVTSDRFMWVDFGAPSWTYGKQSASYYWTVRVIQSATQQVVSAESSPVQFRIAQKERPATSAPKPTSAPQPTDAPQATSKPTKAPTKVPPPTP